ncbi:MAG: trypsin-like serine protease [Pseudobdellovibrionaceae bacterium]
MRILLLSLIMMSMALVSCLKRHQSQLSAASGPAVIGGQKVSEQDALSASVVAVWDEANDFICTGTLIRENIVLTAAHCVLGSAGNLKILFSLDVSSPVSEIRKAIGSRVHEGYRTHQQNNLDQDDIALIKFEGALPAGYKPAVLLQDEKQVDRGTEVIMAGFGAVAAQTNEVDVSSMSEKKIKNEIQDGRLVCDNGLEFCYELVLSGDGVLRSAHAKIQGFTLKEFRLDESKGQGTCNGDSGGPVFLHKDQTDYLFGVTSRGSLSCDQEGIYTNTIEYLDWIDQAIPTL